LWRLFDGYFRPAGFRGNPAREGANESPRRDTPPPSRRGDRKVISVVLMRGSGGTQNRPALRSGRFSVGLRQTVATSSRSTPRIAE
jgi:hypothetical protein